MRKSGGGSSKYTTVRDDLLDRVRRGAYAMGDALPGRLTLCSEYGVSYGTLDRAIGQLVSMGVLETVNGRGTFVTGHAPTTVRGTHGSGAAAVRIAPMPSPQLRRPATLGLVVNSGHGASGVFGVLRRAVEAAFSSAGGSTLVVDRSRGGNQGPQPMRTSLLELARAEVDALIVIGYTGPADSFAAEILAEFDVKQTPAVLIASSRPRVAIPNVYFDDVNAGAAAATHLLQCGYRQIEFLFGHDAPWVGDRIAGARQVLRRGDSDASSFRTWEVSFEKETGGLRQGLAALLDRRSVDWRRLAGAGQPASLICENDEMAREVLELLRDVGPTPGSDLGVIGFDDMGFAGTLGLSSVCPATEEMGCNAARMIVDQLNGTATHFQVSCEARVIARNSTNRRLNATGSL